MCLDKIIGFPTHFPLQSAEEAPIGSLLAYPPGPYFPHVQHLYVKIDTHKVKLYWPSSCTFHGHVYTLGPQELVYIISPPPNI